MTKLELLKKLLPGFLPLFVFIFADELWGTKIGLIVAIVFGIIQFVYIFIREKRFDKFILFDTLLIVVLGLVSIFLNNDIFFKLKPALIGVILSGILGFSAYSKYNIMTAMSKRYIKGISFSEMQLQQLKTSIRVLFYIFSLHTLLVFYSVFFMSKEAWVFISGGLFYIIFGMYFGFEFIKNIIKKRKYKNEEWLPVVDELGKVLSHKPRSKVHKSKKYLHPVVHLHVFNSNGEIFLQKRPSFKKIQPGKWDTAVGGHIGVNETVEQALFRETKEEIGISDINPVFIKKYILESDVERELVFMFMTKKEEIRNFNLNEIDDGKFWSIKQIEINIGEGIFTPNFEEEFEIIYKIISKTK